jgi:hypothetical protein
MSSGRARELARHGEKKEMYIEARKYKKSAG